MIVPDVMGIGKRITARLSDGSDLTGSLRWRNDTMLHIVGAFRDGDTPIDYIVPWTSVVWIRPARK